MIYLGLQYAPPTYKVSGYVKTDGAALSGVAVTLDGKSASTDANGYYEITGLAGNRSYTLSVSMPGYGSYSGTVQLGTQDKVVSDIVLKVAEITAPLTEIRSALARSENVLADNVDVYFSKTHDNDNFAVGAVVSRRISAVFIYTQSTDGIVMENRYAPITADEIAGMDIVVTKQPISRWTSYKIVPFNFVKKGAAYSFDFYDGYDVWGRWGFGVANINEDGNIPEENMTHVWVWQ